MKPTPLNMFNSRAVIGRFYQTVEAELGAGWLSQLAMELRTDQASEQFVHLGMVAMPREWKGSRVAEALRQLPPFAIVGKTWEQTLDFNVDDLRRDKTGQMAVRIGDMARKAARHAEKLVSELIENGAVGLCYDGQPFFSAAHEEGGSGAQSNAISVNVGTTTDPTESEMADAIFQAIAQMLGYKDDRGDPINGEAGEFVVMTPVPLMRAALAAITNRTLVGSSAGNTRENTLLNTGYRISARTNGRLTWTDKFAVFRTDGMTRPFIFLEELPYRMDAIAAGSELEINENKHRYAAKAIHNAGYGQWQHAVQVTLT